MRFKSKLNRKIRFFSPFTACFFAILAIVTFASSCEKIDELENELEKKEPVTFTVHIENVSMPNTLDTERANGTVPLSPGIYATYYGKNPLFMPGQPADSGTARIAEDGFPMEEALHLENNPHVLMSGIFKSPGGPDDGPAIFPGESATFTITAKPGTRLQIETMFVQSNDFFYAFGEEGLKLFHENKPISGDVTSKLVLYDAGTEEDTPPGTGPYQKPVQDPMATDVGPDDSVNQILPARERHPNYNIPPTTSVIKVTITPHSMH